MAEEPQKSKMGGWLRDLAGIFVVIDETKTEEKPASTPAPAQPATSTSKTTAPATSTSTLASTPPASSDFVDDLRNRFRKILEEKNQPGFDFYEFSLMLLRTSTNPSVEHFKTAYEGAKLLNPNCNQQFLLESANFYKSELQKAFEATVSAGEQKKSALNAEKSNEQKQLNNEVANIEQQLGKLKQQIADLEKAQAEKLTALNGIEGKFNDKFVEIEQKIQATITAKEGVANEISLIENGIKQYIA
ncbi:hypothetical protein GVN20_20965 [Runella sp. CRIBMP]|uniref:hypothetical protein n=1 Tax=Runella sp. CRIBMP TaxID=2683261 RepID=UPI001411D003|nr:hypothetical protein [Runella sp. CRIBMP]NBB21848.1 hypothetical protein [Runella sp. CRIBMP]